ncbi:hypothetical protein JRC04_16550 [Mycolicibacterium sp. S2-37]|uniref:hypothetical protein n=1 Tax=Mycolicibacterium sp. S2-37 TaxID=2810297 RepID=UPI001A9434BD|nr:hypothetical protein [Mycolicibacterium sp. S2-37]MBO0679076.1 hypothetical protein [Mycolicibacterium sp. S2-37]
MKFEKSFVSRESRYSLGIEADSHSHYIAIPMSNRMIDYMEYYKLSEHEFQDFLEDPAAASEFAESCRRREQDSRLFMQPGTDRGVPR